MTSEAGDISATLDERAWSPPTVHIPTRLRLLCIGTRQPSWISLTLQLDAAGCLEPQFRWVSTSTEALTLLRDESFECVLICPHTSQDNAAEDDAAVAKTDSLALVRAIRAAGCDDPVVFIARQLDDADWEEACRFECEILVSEKLWDSPALARLLKRAICRTELLRENHRLAVGNHRRLVRERDEAEHLLDQQRQIIAALETLSEPIPIAETDPADAPQSASSSPSSSTKLESSSEKVSTTMKEIPEEISNHYRELLRTYVIMGSGSLGEEIAKVSEFLSVARMNPREAMQLHLRQVETLVRGLGNRSARHVMARADLMALELMMHLGECYLNQSQRADAADTEEI